MWTDSETTKCFSNTCWLLLLLTVKIAVRVTKLWLMREIVSVTRLLHVVTVRLTIKADEVSEVRLVGEIDDELDKVSELRLIMIRFVRLEGLMSDDELD